MDIYGLTGGIGSGKTATGALLEEFGIPVLYADDFARTVVAPGTEGLKAVVEAFGTGVLNEEAELDRERMASLVFTDASKRAQLESILHPRIRACFQQEVDRLAKAGHDIAVYEIPLLFEHSLEHTVKAVIVVSAHEDIRIERVCKRSGISEEEVRKRMATQMSEEERCAKADYIVPNNGSYLDLRHEVELLVTRFLKRPTRTQQVSTPSS